MIRVDQTNYTLATSEPSGWQFAYPPVASIMAEYEGSFPADTLAVSVGMQPQEEWAASMAYASGAPGDYVVPTTRNGFLYECTSAGTSGGTEPAWPLKLGVTVVDGGVTWTCAAVRNWTVWYQGKNFLKVDDFESATLGAGSHPDGIFLVYYDAAGVLQIGDFYTYFLEILNGCPIAMLVWDDLNSKIIALIDFRFGTAVPGADIFMRGLGLPGDYAPVGDAEAVNLTSDAQTGADVAEVQWYIDYDPDSAMFFDLDLIFPVAPNMGGQQDLKVETTPGSGIFHAEVPILWLDADWYRKIDAGVYPIFYDLTGGGRMHYNKVATGVTEAAPSGSYVAMYVMIKTDSAEPYAMMMGQRYDTTIDAARQNNIRGNMAGDLFPGIQYHSRIIYHIDDAYTTNPGHAVAVLIEKFGEVDFNSALNVTLLARTTAVATVSGTYNMDGNEGTIFCDSSGGNCTVNFPATSAFPGRTYQFVQTSASNKTILAATISGVASPEMTARYETRRVISDGTSWYSC